MNLDGAMSRVQQLLDERASRSDICSFINELASEKLITEQYADLLADVLSADRCNVVPVLRMIQEKLWKQ